MLDYSDIETVGPTAEPVTVAECRRHLDLDDSHRDAEIAAWITLARRQVEHDSRVALITRTRARKLHAFPGASHIQLHTMTPLISVSSITYTDTAGATQTLAGANYSVDTARRPGIIWLAYQATWPATRCQPNAVTITYTCGYGPSASYVPPEAKQAMYLVVRHRLDHPELADLVGDRPAIQGYDYLVSMLSTGSYP